MEKFFGLLGIFFWILIAWIFSENKKKISWKLVIKGLGLQLVLILLALGIPSLNLHGPLQFLFAWFNSAITSLLSFTIEGSKFLYGDLVNQNKIGFIFAYQVLPTILFVSALMSILYQLGIMQKIVGFFAWIFFRTMNTSGAETLAAAANIFVGQTEAPLVIRPYIEKMTKSELLSLMVGGMATVAGGVLAAYVALLHERIPDIAGHLLTASILSGPAALLFSKILIPELSTPDTLGKIPNEYNQKIHSNIIEAATDGASEGLKLALNVGAQLLVFIALIALVNGILGWFGAQIGSSELSLQKIFSVLFSPFMIFLGIPLQDLSIAGNLIGQKTILNEFVAYLSLTENAKNLSDRSIIILSYALCGFANFSSIAIQVGGIGAMVPTRKKELSQLGIKALIGGTLASFMTASIAALVL